MIQKLALVFITTVWGMFFLYSPIWILSVHKIWWVASVTDRAAAVC